MSNTRDMGKRKVIRPFNFRIVALPIIFCGLFLSISNIGYAADAQLSQTSNSNMPVTLGKQLPKTPSSINKSFFKDIRAAIAARWQASQLHSFVEAVTSPPVQYVQPARPPVSGNSFKPFVGYSMLYDSNVLRIADQNTAALALAGKGKSDFIKQIRAGIAAKWSFKRQVLLINAVINQTWYSVYNQLNYLGRDILVNWNWQLGKYLTGEIGYNNKVALGSFSQINALIDNLQTTNQFFAKGEYELIPSWFLQAGAAYRTTSNGAATYQTNNLNETIGNIGIKHLTPLKNQFGLNAIYTDGQFVNRTFTQGDTIDNAYARYDFVFDWAWKYSVKTTFDGSVGYIQQRFEHLPIRNFSEPTARANVNWNISDKTALTFSGWRDVYFISALNANFVLSQGVRITPTWLVTPKLQFKFPMSYETQAYLGDPGFDTTQTAVAELDKITLLGLNADYVPFQNGKVSLLMQLEDRSSNNLSRNYQSKSVGLNMQLSF